MEDIRIIRERFFEVIKKTSIEKPMTELKIAQIIGLSTSAELREKIIAPLRTEGFPVASGVRGVFLAHNAGELERTLQHLTSRRNSYWKLIKGVEIAQARLRCGHNPLEMQERLF